MSEVCLYIRRWHSLLVTCGNSSCRILHLLQVLQEYEHFCTPLHTGAASGADVHTSRGYTGVIWWDWWVDEEKVSVSSHKFNMATITPRCRRRPYQSWSQLKSLKFSVLSSIGRVLITLQLRLCAHQTQGEGSAPSLSKNIAEEYKRGTRTSSHYVWTFPFPQHAVNRLGCFATHRLLPRSLRFSSCQTLWTFFCCTFLLICGITPALTSSARRWRPLETVTISHGPILFILLLYPVHHMKWQIFRRLHKERQQVWELLSHAKIPIFYWCQDWVRGMNTQVGK